MNNGTKTGNVQDNGGCHKCPLCDKMYKRKSDLTVHHKQVHAEGIVPNCNVCGKQFASNSTLYRHIREKHEAPVLATSHEAPAIPTASAIPDQLFPPPKPMEVDLPAGWTLAHKKALKDSLVSYYLNIAGVFQDPDEVFENSLVPAVDQTNKFLYQHHGMKLNMIFKIKFYKPVNPEETTTAHFWSQSVPILRGDRVEDKIRSAFPKIQSRIDQFTRKGSGWAIEKILNVQVDFAKYSPLRGTSYIELPKELADKHAIINVHNDDQLCFLWSILAAIHKKPHNEHRVSPYRRYLEELNIDGIAMPMELKDIPKFERLNGLSINIYGYEEEIVHPLYISTSTNTRHIGLLLFEGHYTWIKNLDRLLYDQNKHKSKKYFCHRCLFPQYSKERRRKHLEMCILNDPTRVEMAAKPHIQFENIQRILRQPTVVYADFECLTTPLEENISNTTEKYQHHVPCGYGLVEARSCCGQAEFQPSSIYRGRDCVSRFLTEIIQIGVEHQNMLNNPEDLLMTEADEQRLQCEDCYVCKKSIIGKRVRDHCHICGRFRGPTHNSCNQGFRLNRNIVVVFHNLRRYDGHLIMQEIGAICEPLGFELDCIAKTMEDYLGFSIINRKCKGEPGWSIKFIDSFQFLSTSLDNLVQALPNEKFNAMKKEFADPSLLLQKGVYPYDYMDSWSRFSERQLPEKDSFYSKLNDCDISNSQYEHAQKVWSTFNIEKLGEYHDLYLQCDVLQLADVVEEFRNVCLNNYGLDPMHYVTLPSFAWDACLKMTDIKLDTLDDPDMYSFFESGIRGGISVISHRHAEANNKQCKGYDETKPKSYIMYMDANNLYGYAMSLYLPTSNFEWLEREEINNIVWENVPNEGDTGYVLEVDLEYPENLHEKHNDYPLAPEHMEIDDEMLSPYCKSVKDHLKLNPVGCKKLITNLRNKTHYVVHIQNLQLYLRLGMRLTKVHKVVKFQQSPWLRQYIDANTALRTQAKTDFEKDLFKLMNNAVFGKTMENVRSYKEVKLETSDIHYRKLVKKPRYKRSVRFNDNLVGVQLARLVTYLDKAIYVGFSVLDLSKTKMYQHHYDYMVPTYGAKAKLLFTDTDSLMYHVETDDIYEDMEMEKNRFDTSNYPEKHPLFSNENKKVIGKMKDETAGVPINEFVGLRSKMYSFKCNGVDKKRAKGIKKATVKNQMTFGQYKSALFDRKLHKHSMQLIQATLHEMYSIKMTKCSLSPFDDKRYLTDGIASYAYGHKEIP